MARKVRSIAGRPAMITGAASGIGRSLSRSGVLAVLEKRPRAAR